MKQAFLNGMLSLGGFAAFRRANRRKVLIVTYHRFSAEERRNATSARALDEQLAYLTKHYTVLPLQIIADHLKRGTPPPPGAAALTIDDGFRDSYQVAYPILRRYQAPATIFVATDFLDRKMWLWTDKLRYLTSRAESRQDFEVAVKDQRLRLNLNGPESRLTAATRVNAVLKTLPDAEKEAEIENVAAALGVALPRLPPAEYEPLAWDEAREMDAGGVAVESHTVTHPILTNVGEEQLHYELRQSRARLRETLGKESNIFCYPNGGYNANVRRAVESAGYQAAVSTAHGLNDKGSDLFALRRVHTEDDLAHFAQNTSGFENFKDKLRGRVASAPAAVDY